MTTCTLIRRSFLAKEDFIPDRSTYILYFFVTLIICITHSVRNVLSPAKNVAINKKYNYEKQAGLKIILYKSYIFLLPTFLIVFGVLITYLSFSQRPVTNNIPDKYRAVLWTSDDGLSLGIKNTILKDVKGFLWIISPAGLNRFDGSTFKIYYSDKTTPGSIDGFYSFSLVEDSLHNIWIGTNKGLSRYDIKSDTFKNFSSPGLSVTSVAAIIPFWATRNEVYCIESGNKVISYNIQSFEKKVVAHLDHLYD